MKTRYRLIRRGHRGSKLYCVDTLTGRRASLGTTSQAEAREIVLAKNQALRQPELNLRIAPAYLAGSNPAHDQAHLGGTDDGIRPDQER